MKITDLNGAYRAYAKNTAPGCGQQKSAQKEDRTVAGQQDRVSISSAAHKDEVDRLVYSTAAEVEAKVTAGRIGELKQAVADGTYQVPAEKLAEALLSAYA